VKILLDECLPLDFRHSFPHQEAHTVEWAGLKGAKNGELLKAADAAGYDVLLTVDRGLQHQQPHSGRRLAIVVIHSLTNQLEDLLPLVDEILRVMERIEPGQIVEAGAPD
jgi:predicted nuclease of predicted toxin-antitoxin system